MDADNARKTWELQNNIVTVDPADQVYLYDKEAHNREVNGKPWAKDPHYFTKVKISAVALIKMVMHARSGGVNEVMGYMQGKIQGDTMIVMDSFALPVEGTETRVNAMNEANEYSVNHTETCKQVGRLENVLGWYHSHPGYGCWLSGIDCSTQLLMQQFQEPFVAVVIDPNRTISAGKVEIGAFRTFPPGYKPADEGPSEYQTIPLIKIEDFGVYAKTYYQLEVSHFKSTLDQHLLELLWKKYWVNTLSQSPLLSNREYAAFQLTDLAEKLDQADGALGQTGRAAGFAPGDKKSSEEGKLSKVTRDSSKITVEAAHGLISQVLKNLLFNNPRGFA